MASVVHVRIMHLATSNWEVGKKKKSHWIFQDSVARILNLGRGSAPQEGLWQSSLEARLCCTASCF